MVSERKLSVSVSAEILAEMSVSVLVSALLKLSVHSLAEISAFYTAIIPTFCLKFTLFRFFSQNILRF
jgi:hypothetical protein